jgi:polyferredoxin
MTSKRQRFREVSLFVSMLLFPITFYYLSPYLIVLGASEGIVSGSFILFSLLFFSSFIVGRLWCAWICPGAEVQELCYRVRKKGAKGGKLDLIKLGPWAVWVVVIILLFIRSGGISSVDPLYQTWYGISILASGAVFVLVMVLLLISGLSLAFGRRGFCHYGCCMAPFMIVGGKLRDLMRVPHLRLRADRSKCIRCRACSRNCPMSLDVEGMVTKGNMNDSECINCGTCIDVCPKGVIRYGFGAR